MRAVFAAFNQQLSSTESLHGRDLADGTHRGISTNISVNIPVATKSNGGPVQRRLPQIPTGDHAAYEQKPLVDNDSDRYIMPNRKFVTFCCLHDPRATNDHKL